MKFKAKVNATDSNMIELFQENESPLLQHDILWGTVHEDFFFDSSGNVFKEGSLLDRMINNGETIEFEAKEVKDSDSN